MKESPYPVLRDRPIDQWKVTELKDELKRRKLTVRGLKEDLVRRLDEALRIEMESSNQEEVEDGNDDDDDDDSQPKGQDHADEKAPIVVEPLNVTSEVEGGVGISVKDADQAGDKKIEAEDVSVQTAPITIETLSETLTPEVEGDQAGAKNVEAGNISVQNIEDDNMKISDQDLGQKARELTHGSPSVKDELTTLPSRNRKRGQAQTDGGRGGKRNIRQSNGSALYQQHLMASMKASKAMVSICTTESSSAQASHQPVDKVKDALKVIDEMVEEGAISEVDELWCFVVSSLRRIEFRDLFLNLTDNKKRLRFIKYEYSHWQAGGL